MAWRAGPFAIETKRRAPADWPVDDQAPGFVVDVTEEQVPWSPGALSVVSRADAVDAVDVVRPGGYAATIHYGEGVARYRGLVDVVEGTHLCPIFESFLRVLCSGATLRNGGALLHASSVIMQGRAWVFCGLSGAGKTTLVDGTADDEYLSDDQSIVTRTSAAPTAGFMAWGTPFSGSAARRARPIAAPVAAFVLLDPSRGEQNHLARRTDLGRAAGELLRHVCAHERSAAEAKRALDFAAQVVMSTPVFSLRRHIDTPLARIVAEMIASSSSRHDDARLPSPATTAAA